VDDLIAFVKARLDEDEAAAKAAHPGPWILEEEVGGFGPVAWISVPFGHGMPNAKSGLTSFAPLGTQDAETMRHIARHDPARVLREVEAKRAILAAYAEADDIGESEATAALWTVMCAFAKVWDDHPDYAPDLCP
jgi:hypothetical protein